MNITIFPTGKSGAQSAVNYLLSDVDHDGKKRSHPPEILSGDPVTFEAIANSTKRAHKYTSGVIAFRDQESITPEQISTLIETFRSTFLPRLEVDKNFSDFWVAHRDKGNLELHFLVANTELTTGQQLNIHPPGQKNIDFFNTFVAVMNDNLGFAQVVADPLKIALKPFEAKSENGKKNKKAKNDFAKVLHAEIAGGFITNRNQLIGYLKRHGMDVPTVGTDFVTVRLPGSSRNTRLKGPLFEKDSDYAALLKQHAQAKTPKFLTPTEAKQKKEQLVEGIEARAAFNQRRYLTPRPGANRHPSTLDTPVASKRPYAATDQPEQQPTPKPAQDTLERQLSSLRQDASPLKSPSLPHQRARVQDEHERDGPLASVLGHASLGGLEAQIGSLSMQYHTLRIQLMSATGRRAEQIRAQMVTVEQKLASLNLELEKKKLELSDPLKPKIT